LLNDAGRSIGSTADRVVEEIDAGGLYACLTRFRHYVEHQFEPYDGCAFGPDIEWGSPLRQKGYRNYLDWSVSLERHRPDGTSVHPGATWLASMRFEREKPTWLGQITK
jgi:hypothetical protein